MNHKGTFRHETAAEGFLWSPQREKNARSTSYDNMCRIRRGDVILSYANKETRFIGRATDSAIAALKPEAFGAKGWTDEGWYVPVDWNPLPSPFRHREIWGEFRPLLPARISPVMAKTGNGNQKVYLAEVSIELIELACQTIGMSLPALLASDLRHRSADEARDQSERRVEAALPGSLEDTERVQQIKARAGQGRFREAVLQLAKACRVTGVDHPDLLIASHIKPWHACTTPSERLDGNNGLMLTPNVDRLFDRGFISFADEGDILVVGDLEDEVLRLLGVPDLRAVNVGPFNPAQRAYLAYHREHEFLDRETPRPLPGSA